MRVAGESQKRLVTGRRGERELLRPAFPCGFHVREFRGGVTPDGDGAPRPGRRASSRSSVPWHPGFTFGTDFDFEAGHGAMPVQDALFRNDVDRRVAVVLRQPDVGRGEDFGKPFEGRPGFVGRHEYRPPFGTGSGDQMPFGSVCPLRLFRRTPTFRPGRCNVRSLPRCCARPAAGLRWGRR